MQVIIIIRIKQKSVEAHYLWLHKTEYKFSLMYTDIASASSRDKGNTLPHGGDIQ